MTKEIAPDILKNSENLVVFQLNLIHYAIKVETIQQIIEMVTITPLLTTQTWMEGVINYHGHSVPVINLRRHFGMEVKPYGWHTPIILVNILNRLVGLIVDEVLDVTPVAREAIINPYSIIPSGLMGTPLLESIILTDNKIILLLDLAHLFDQSQVQALAVAVETLGEQPERVIVKKTKKSIPQKQTNEATPALAGGARDKKAEKIASASPKNEKTLAQKSPKATSQKADEL
jgi:purine-binding chemotaxis protein CheW